MAIFLHELAHHLNGDTANPDDDHIFKQELDADEIAGRRMALLGASLPQAQHYLSLIWNPPCDQDSAYEHPCLEKRLDAVARGWYDEKGMTTFYTAMLGKTRFNGAVNAQDFDPERYLQPEHFFEHDHCIRSFENTCHVVLNEVRLGDGTRCYTRECSKWRAPGTHS